MVYIGSIILPFHDFSYVLKIQCLELGTTGFRDAIVLDRMMAAGEVQFDVTTRTMRGWMQDPYDPSIRDVFARNRSEERRVGKECRYGRRPAHSKKKPTE